MFYCQKISFDKFLNLFKQSRVILFISSFSLEISLKTRFSSPLRTSLLPSEKRKKNRQKYKELMHSKSPNQNSFKEKLISKFSFTRYLFWPFFFKFYNHIHLNPLSNENYHLFPSRPPYHFRSLSFTILSSHLDRLSFLQPSMVCPQCHCWTKP